MLPNRRWIWLGALGLICAGFGVYFPSLGGPFVFDDIPAVVQNTTIRDLTDLEQVLSPPAEGAGIDSRPVVNLSLALDYAAAGLDPRSFRLTNVTLHVFGALALFGLVRRTLTLPSIPERWSRASLPVAWSTALLWTAHPLQTETVICVIQRTEGLVSFWYLCMLYCFVRAVEPAGDRRWLVIAWASCLLGMASKEVMVTAPFIAFLYDRTFVTGSFREAWRAHWRWYTAFAATWLLLAWLVTNSGADRGGTAGYGQGVSAWTYLLTQARAITLYLKLSLWPHPLVLDYGAWLAPGLRVVLGEFLFIATLFGATIYAVVRHPRVGFLGACFFGILAPSSSVYPLVSQTIAEHRMHLPLAAALVLLMLGVFRLPMRMAMLSALVLATAAAVGTVRRGADYSTELTLWTDVVDKSPSNPWARYNLGQVHFRAGRFADAERENRAVIVLMPSHADGHFALGMALERQGRWAEAAVSYQKALELKPQIAEWHFRLGLMLLHLGKPAEAIPHFAETLRQQPAHGDAEGNWGAALYQLGRPADAVPHFERVLALHPNSVEARYNLALLLLQAGRPEAALPHLEAAAKLAPHDQEILGNLQRVLSQLGRHAEARRIADELAAAR
ncbi:MAG TPA: tetratricopeptide repeat protein [Lacunisphaera sp.]